MPASAWVLFGGTFVNRFGGFVVPFLILYVVHEGYSASVAGIAASAYGVGSIGASFGGGVMADRLGRQVTIATSMFASAAAMLALSQARGIVWLALLAGVAGLTSELYRPASSALLADLVPPNQRVTAYASYRLAVNLGYAAGPATAGFLADRSFFLLFLIDALTSLVFGVLAIVALPRHAAHLHSESVRGERAGAILRDPRFLLLLCAYLAGAFVYFQSFSTLPLHVRASGLPNVAYGFLLSLNGLVVIFLELPLSSLTQRLPARPVIAFGLFLLGTGFALTGAFHSLALLALTVLVWTVGEIVHSPVSQAYVAALAPPHLRGRYQGAFGMTWGIGLVLAPVLGTRLFAWNEVVLWAACGVLGMFAAGLVLAGPGEKYAFPT
ncbi:MAG: MDR family MFS transporter [Chloroflexota bacterium]